MLSKIDYHGWPSVQLGSSKLELIAPLAVGPRIISLRRPEGGKNLLFEFKGQIGGSGEAEFCLRGGHRLWHAPEHAVRTYQPDNVAPAFAELPKGRGFSLVAPVEAKTGIEKAVRVELVADDTVKLTHTLTNRGLWPVETAAWALTMLRRGGMSVIPLLPKGEHPRDLLPTYSMVPWSYTDLGLPAWKFFPGFIRVETTKVPAAQKLGLTAYPGWSAYWIDGDLFVKSAEVKRGASYPDFGCPFETYADTSLTELETLSPLEVLAPGRKIVHTETWGLLSGVPKPASEAVYRAEILPAVHRWLESAG
jgi:hypothetical protein